MDSPKAMKATVPDSSHSDFWTVVAIAIVATVCADLIHEGLGHGGACLLTGGHPLAASTVHFDCEAGGILVAAAGTIANLVAGAAFWLLSHTVRRATSLRYFLWLSMTINLFGAGGYFLFSGITNFGDWADVILGQQPLWLWRAGLTALGVVSYLFFMWVALREMRPFLGREYAGRVQRARRLTLIPYLTDGILSCLAGLFNPVGMILIAVSAAASSFGGASGLAWMHQWLHGTRIPTTEFQMPPLTRSRIWMVAAAVVAVAFVVVLGPGVKFHSRSRASSHVEPWFEPSHEIATDGKPLYRSELSAGRLFIHTF